MTEVLAIGDNTLAYDLTGDGPLVVLAHGIGDSRHAYRFLAPALVEAGYRVANLDIRGCGESSIEWDGYSRTDIAGDLVALVRHLGGPAVIIGHSISGGAATIAAATAPELIVGLIELAPFTRAVTYSMGALLTNKRYRRATTLLGRTLLSGNINAWQKYLDLAYPTKPADWDDELARIVTVLREPGRAKTLQAMCKSAPTDAGAQLGNVQCPVLVVEGDADPDFADPRAEGDRIVADLPTGIGEVAVLDGVGHYPHTQAPDEPLAVTLPFLAKALHHA
ncbi:alpha/beta hydrolase [Rhodococcus sp. IEGM 1354]|uniref:alpha/beta fold hydrolase n=1 Tax=Rhodococcus sp. IEGM 1354 TaxID=3047088 RepID=UPI0024B80005|nr:alpha/beta hydrolase [Rhodococcus sp. IEGM 1354]MDI9929490.1 alpha/beta hydrolase [Rhodococcus sp. IEGM 1354]